jgi:hypothetical protein
MRRIAWTCLILCGCFDPSDSASDDGASDSTDTSASTTQTSLGETTDGNDTVVTATLTDPTGDSTTVADTTTADETTTVADDTADSTTTTDTGPVLGCADFDGRVIYINMDGATLSYGLADNGPANIINDEYLAREWPPYTTDDADEVYALVEEHWAPFHVCVTRDVPQVPDYTMIVVSSETFQDDPNFIGNGHDDCGDIAPNSVNVVVLSEEAGIASTAKAIGISKFTAKMFGLESVAAPEDIMNMSVGSTLNAATFTDECFMKTGAFHCESAVACGDGEQQSGPYLEAIFGAR